MPTPTSSVPTWDDIADDAAPTWEDVADDPTPTWDDIVQPSQQDEERRQIEEATPFARLTFPDAFEPPSSLEPIGAPAMNVTPPPSANGIVGKVGFNMGDPSGRWMDNPLDPTGLRIPKQEDFESLGLAENVPTGEEVQQFYNLPKAAQIVTTPVSAVTKLGAGIVDYLVSPQGAWEVAGSVSPAAPIVYAKWAYDMIHGAGVAAKDAIIAVKDKIMQSRREARNAVSLNPEQAKPEDSTSAEFYQRMAEDAVNAAVLFKAGKGSANKAVSMLEKASAELAPRGVGITEAAKRPFDYSAQPETPLPNVETAKPIEQQVSPELIADKLNLTFTGDIGGAWDFRFKEPGNDMFSLGVKAGTSMDEIAKARDAKISQLKESGDWKESSAPKPSETVNLPKEAWFTPQIPGKQGIALFQSSGLPSGKFFALDKPFESDAHDVSQAKKVPLPQVEKVYDPDGLIGPPTENLHEGFVAEESKVKMPKSGYGLKELQQIRDRFADYLRIKGYDSYVRAIDGNVKDRELIVLEKPSPKPTQGAAQPEQTLKNPSAPALEARPEMVVGKPAEKVGGVKPQKGKVTIKVPNPYGLAREGDKILTVTGDVVKIDVVPEIDFVAYKTGKGWRVVEKTTGLAPGSSYGKTKSEAILKAKENIDTVGAEKLWLAMDRANKINLEEPQGAIASSQPLTPSATSTVTLTPKSQRQIITELAKGLNVPIRFGRLTTSKFAGYFRPRSNLIGSKKAIDVPTVSHEVGHKLDDTLKLSDDKTIAAELDVLGDPSTPGSGSSWTPSKTKTYKMGEGVAEFVRYWLTDPAKALKDAPNTHKAFEALMATNKDFGDVMRQAQEDIRVWKDSEPQARLRSQISTSNPNKTRYTLSQLTRDVVDDLHILRLAVEDAKKSGDLPPSQDPYLAARNLRGSYGMAETFIRNGVADFNTKEVKLGTSLEDALKPVAGKLSDFRDWIVSKRAQELRKQGKETGLVASDVDAVVSKFDKDPIFQKAFNDVKAWNDAALDYAVQSGLITPESAAAMRKMNQDYVPFHRLFEVGAGEAPSQTPQGIGMGLNVGKPGSFRRLSGSTREIVDPIETMIKNAYTIITASEKAAINRSVAEMASLPNMGKWVERVATPKEGVRFDLERVKKQLEDAGADLTGVPDDLILSFFRQSGRAPFGENIIRVIRNGEPEFYRLNRDLHDTFQALDLEDSGKLVRILSAPAQLLRSGVVLEPSFNVANALRDTFSAAVIGKYGAFPFETTLKGVAAMIKNPQAVAEWAAAGGKNSVEANFFDRTKMQKFLTEKISKDLTPAERAMIVSKSPLTALRWLTSKGEEATRIGEYQIAYKRLTESGMPPGEARRLAAFESRDRQDFAKGGAKTKIIRHMSAFWNASLQANVKLAQAFKERPARTILQGLAFVTIPKLLEQAINWDDEDYWNRQQWERDLFFLIPAGKDKSGHTRFIRIPTPFEVGIIFGTFPGRLLQWLKTNKPESVEGFPQMMLKQSVPNPIPQTLQVAFEDFLSGDKGWDIWRGRTVVPESLADLPPDLQWTDQTSTLAKEVGKKLNFSPMKVDHIIERTTGGMGKVLTGRQAPGQRFVAAPLAVSNQAINDFYEKLDTLREEHARVKATKTGKEPSQLKRFEDIARQLSELRNQSRTVQDESKKAAIQEKMYQLAKKEMAKQK